jgi:hypothetical protein
MNRLVYGEAVVGYILAAQGKGFGKRKPVEYAKGIIKAFLWFSAAHKRAFISSAVNISMDFFIILGICVFAVMLSAIRPL